jgi:hypothetical protein
MWRNILIQLTHYKYICDIYCCIYSIIILLTIHTAPVFNPLVASAWHMYIKQFYSLDGFIFYIAPTVGVICACLLWENLYPIQEKVCIL